MIHNHSWLKVKLFLDASILLNGNLPEFNLFPAER